MEKNRVVKMFVKLLIVNVLTLIRVIGTIVLVPIYHTYGGYSVSILALICYLTDSIDGILARKFKASTFFGAIFDGAADKLFTLMNFIVLYLITPYAIIPIIIELLIVLVQIMKYHYNYNVQSNMVGKFKTWVLAISVILTFLVSDINRVSFLSETIKTTINGMLPDLYFWLLVPAIIMEALTLLSYIEEVFNGDNKKEVKVEVENKNTNQSTWKNFKNIWLDPDYYSKHKDDANIRKITKVSKK